MKWTLDAVNKRLDEIETSRREKKAKFDKELKDSRTKLQTLETSLQEAEDPEEYKKLLREKTEAETYIEFLTKHKKTTPTDTTDRAEYKEIFDTLVNDVEDLQSDYLPKVEKAFNSLLNVLDEYYTKANAIEEVRDRACQVYCGHGINGYKTNEIVNKVNDPLLYADHMLRAFFIHRTTVAHCYRRIMSPRFAQTSAIYSTTDEARICEELQRRIKKGTIS